MLEVQNLSKSFYNTQALDEVSFKVNPGEVFALLGPNGAGKTTAMRLIMHILKPDEGEILYKNEPRSNLKRNLFGYLPEERGLYQRSKVLDLLVYIGMLNRLSHHRAEIEAIRYLDKLGLVDYTQKRVGELSKGMQQKIQFILAILHDPDILILDEPFVGLDPVNQMVLRDIVNENKKEGKIIILSTHQMSEVEIMADHILLLNQGRIILEGSLKEIKSRFKENAFYLEVENNISAIKDIKDIKIIEEHNNSCKFAINGKDTSKDKVLQTLFQKIPVKKFIELEPSLNEIFIKLVQNGSDKNRKKV
jgi:ABC-2 type transport system ATP-binding protein